MAGIPFWLPQGLAGDLRRSGRDLSEFLRLRRELAEAEVRQDAWLARRQAIVAAVGIVALFTGLPLVTGALLTELENLGVRADVFRDADQARSVIGIISRPRKKSKTSPDSPRFASPTSTRSRTATPAAPAASTSEERPAGAQPRRNAATISSESPRCDR